jgi:hypothetical protein
MKTMSELVGGPLLQRRYGIPGFQQIKPDELTAEARRKLAEERRFGKQMTVRAELTAF